MNDSYYQVCVAESIGKSRFAYTEVGEFADKDKALNYAQTISEDIQSGKFLLESTTKRYCMCVYQFQYDNSMCRYRYNVNDCFYWSGKEYQLSDVGEWRQIG
jgi:hypothetical protein